MRDRNQGYERSDRPRQGDGSMMRRKQ